MWNGRSFHCTLFLNVCTVDFLTMVFGPFQMAPLFDTTITDIRLATHGQAEAMNAALICSIATSTFNTQLESWEPLMEPFDGIFK